MLGMVSTYASATSEQPTCLGNEPLHVGEALLPKVERNVNNVCHKAKCCKSWVNASYGSMKACQSENGPCNGECRKRVKRPPLLLCSWNVAGMSCNTDASDTVFDLLSLAFQEPDTCNSSPPVVTWGQQVACQSSGGGWRRLRSCRSPPRGRLACTKGNNWKKSCWWSPRFTCGCRGRGPQGRGSSAPWPPSQWVRPLYAEPSAPLPGRSQCPRALGELGKNRLRRCRGGEHLLIVESVRRMMRSRMKEKEVRWWIREVTRRRMSGHPVEATLDNQRRGTPEAVEGLACTAGTWVRVIIIGLSPES